MGQTRFSVTGMLGIVALVGVTLASLRSASPLTTSAASTATLAVLLSAALGAIYLRGPERAYATGFALFGWSYLLLVNGSSIGGQFGHDLTGGLGDLAESVFPPDPRPPATPSSGWVQQNLLRNVTIGNFVQIVRLSISLVFALLGGFVARRFASWTETAARKDDTPGAPAH